MADYEVKDSGERQAFATGAVRDTQVGKGRFDLLPPNGLARLAIHFEKGAVKYGENNYLKGMPLSRFLDSALRHICKYMAGQDDEDHLIAAAWNLIAAVETESRIISTVLPAELMDIGPHKDQIRAGLPPTKGVQ